MTTMYYGKPLVTLTFDEKNGTPQDCALRYKKIITEDKGREMLNSRSYSGAPTHKEVILMLATAHDFMSSGSTLYGELFYFIQKERKMCPHFVAPEAVLQEALKNVREKKIIVATRPIVLWDKEQKHTEHLFTLNQFTEGVYRLGSKPVTCETVIGENEYILVLEQVN